MTTPRPWKIKEVVSHNLFSGKNSKAWHVDIGSNCTVLCPNNNTAALIVQAVNSHDALVGALESYQGMTDNILKRNTLSQQDFETLKTALRFTLPAAQAALAVARGKERV